MYKKDHHRLLQWSAQFIISLFDIRRGREGISELKVKHHTKKHDQDLKMDYYVKALGEESKNHHHDSENLLNAGIIPCVVNSYGTNPGLVLDLYISHLNPSCEFMFQRPQRQSKTFKLDEPDTKVLYEATKVGINHVGKMLPQLCKLLEIETTYTNHCVRSTGIMLLKEGGYSDRDIIKLTGHKAEASLSHYDPGNALDKKAEMAEVLLLKPKRKSDSSSSDKENQPPSPKVQVLDETALTVHETLNKDQQSFPFQQYLFREQDLRAAESRRSTALQDQVLKMNDILMKKFLD